MSRSIDWETLVDWKRLPRIRADLDLLPVPVTPPAERLTAIETTLAVLASREFTLNTRPETSVEAVAVENARTSPYLTLPETAAYCRRTPKTLSNLKAAGRLRAVPGTRPPLFLVEDLDEWLAGSRRGRTVLRRI